MTDLSQPTWNNSAKRNMDSPKNNGEPTWSTESVARLAHSTRFYSALLYFTPLYSTPRCSALNNLTLLYSTLPNPTLLYSTLLYSTLLHSTLLYSTMPRSTLLASTPLYPALLYAENPLQAQYLEHLEIIQDNVRNAFGHRGSNPGRSGECRVS